MGFHNNLTALRKVKGYSQEELAYQLGVSRQSVSKWELGQSSPELDRIIEIAQLFDVTVDELICGDYIPGNVKSIDSQTLKETIREVFHYEYKSRICIGKIPLVHIHFGRGLYVAKGIFAFGNIAIGLFSMGAVAIGAISIGGLALGMLALAGISIGILSFGGVSIGYIAIGGLSLGIYAIGGFALGAKLAIGGMAHGYIAIGSSVHGTHVLQGTAANSVKDVVHFISQYDSIPDFIIRWLSIFI